MSLLPAGGEWDGVDVMVEGAVSVLSPELQQPDLEARVEATGSDVLAEGAGEE
jgi:hypothetical protein